jgi:putative transposase
MLLEKDSPLSFSKQCSLLGINRTSFYYKPKPKDESRIEEHIVRIYTKRPFYGHRKIKKELERNNIFISNKKTLRLMKKLNIKALYPKKCLSLNTKEHEKYPYLLKNVTPAFSNHVWQTDITYLKLSNGYAYLSTLIDVYSRKILSYELSNTLDVNFCINTVKKAISVCGRPYCINSDQGSQYTSLEFIELLKKENIKISMNSKGRALDNIFIERFFRSLKYEDVYLNKYSNVLEAKNGIAAYIDFYNTERFHQSLDYRTPDDVYFYNSKAVA